MTTSRAAIWAVVIVGALSWVASARASYQPLVELGQLNAPGNSGSVSFSSVSSSGQTAVASGSGVAYVFTEPAGGWSTEEPAAQLTDPDGRSLSDAVVSGSTVFAIATASSGGPTYPDQIDVFTEPGGGWSGSVTPSAMLTATDGGDFSAAVISNGAVIAPGYSDASGAGELYTFIEPAAGWSGTVHESSETQLPDSYYAASAAGNTLVLGGTTDGTTVVAPPDPEEPVLVYEEPATGWTGTLAPPATLEPPWTQVGGVNVYTEPANGWQGVVYPTARFPLDVEDESTAAISGNMIAVASDGLATGMNFCPCTGNLRLFQEPSSGWPALLQAPSVDTVYTDKNGAVPLAFDGETLFAGIESPPGVESSALEIFRIQPPIEESPIEPSPPRIGHPKTTITGLTDGKPHIQFHVHSGSHSPPLQSLTVTVPAGVEFSRNGPKLKTGVTVLREFPTLSLSQGRLVVTAPNQNYLLVKIGRPAITETQKLKNRIASITRYDEHHRRHQRTMKLTLVVRVTDIEGHTTRFSVVTTVR
jgi:hypothetical protein